MCTIRFVTRITAQELAACEASSAEGERARNSAKRGVPLAQCGIPRLYSCALMLRSTRNLCSRNRYFHSLRTTNRQHGARRPRNHSIGHAAAESGFLACASSAHNDQLAFALTGSVENLFHCVAKGDLNLRTACLNC